MRSPKGNQKVTKLFLQFPDGSIIENQADMDRLMTKFTFTPSTESKWILHKPDKDAFALASARLASIGFNDEPFFAFGPVQFKGYPKSHNTYTADAILTSTYLIIYYQKSLLVPDFLILPLLALSGLSSIGPWSAQFNFTNGIHREKKGVFEITSIYFELSERLGKDGQANRRSITLMRSLGNTINEFHPE